MGVTSSIIGKQSELEGILPAVPKFAQRLAASIMTEEINSEKWKYIGTKRQRQGVEM